MQATTRKMEYLTTSRFYFEYDASNRLLLSKCSGLSISIDPAAEGQPIGVGKGCLTQTQITPTGVTYENMTLEFVTTGENDILLDWYLACHPKSAIGGGTQQMENRFSGGLVFYKQDGSEGARWSIRDAIPAKYSSTQVQSESTDLFKETIEIAHAGLVRVPTGGSNIGALSQAVSAGSSGPAAF
ncbi:MAG: phage tail protein [Pseudanabaenales cyanobacterium]|nr:phage tail protein [Pseudanabaenales cyanobacterium]